MSTVFEQLFYGRGAHGYGILGASPGTAGLASHVEELCGAVGTPSGDYGGEPFLMSVPDGRLVIMVCGHRGTPDSMGRATLFFHVLVAEKDALSAAKADAFLLFEQGAFTDKMPAGDVATLSFDVSGAISGRGGYQQLGSDKLDVTVPCIFRSEKPAAKLVRNAIGNRVNELSWTTFAFQSLQGFDVQVLSQRTTAQWSVTEYDASGNLIRSASAVISSHVDKKPQSDVKMTRQEDSDRRKKSSRHMGNPVLKLSIVANIVFIAIIAVLVIMRDTPSCPSVQQAGPPTGEPTFTAAVDQLLTKRKLEIERIAVDRLLAERKPELERIAVDRILEARNGEIKKIAVDRMLLEHNEEIEHVAIKQLQKEWFETFGRDSIIDDFDVSVTNLPNYDEIMKGRRFAEQKAFIEKLKFYVDFVNQKTKEKQNP